MPHTCGLAFANYSKNLNRLLLGRNCSVLASGLQRRHFGVELEFCDYTSRYESEVDYDTAYAAINSLFEPINADSDSTSLFEVKDDGSLYGNAFEFVTSPMTMNLLRMLNWEDFFDVIKANNYIQTDFNECDKAGIHVHVNRKSLQYPFNAAVNALLFITANEDTIRRFARRAQPTWDSWCATPYCLEDGQLSEAIAYAEEGNYSVFGGGFGKKFRTDETRYRCVNFMSNNTWELRIFNSTLKAKDMYNILDFTDALWQVCDTETYDMSLEKMADKLHELGNDEVANYMFEPPEEEWVCDDYSYRWDEEEDDDDDYDDDRDEDW